MTNVFPTSNLPTVSQPWGREVQKRIDILESQFSLQKTNSATIDAQLQASYRRLDGNVIAAQQAATDAGLAAAQALTAINGLIGLGNSSGSTYSINANNITAGTINASNVTVSNINASNITSGTINASTVTITNLNASNISTGTLSGDRITGGTITGTVIQSRSSGQRVVVNSSTLDFFNSSGQASGSLAGGGGQGVFIQSEDGNTDVTVLNAGASMYQIGGGYVGVDSGGTTIGANSGRTYFQDPRIEMPFITSDTSAANIRWGAGGGGRLFFIPSARKYKLDIQDATANLEALNLRPRTWIDKGQYERNGNSAEGLYRVPGFVAEEVLEAGLEEFVTYDEDGEIQGLSYERMTAALIPVLKHQQNVIEELTARIETLENGAN